MVPKWHRCISIIRTITHVTSVFTVGACSDYPLSCNLAFILPVTGVLLRVSATTSESVIGGISAPHTPHPRPPYPALMVEGLQGLTAALKLESRREKTTGPRNVWIVWIAFLFRRVLGRWLQLSQSFVRMLDNPVHRIYA